MNGSVACCAATGARPDGRITTTRALITPSRATGLPARPKRTSSIQSSANSKWPVRARIASAQFSDTTVSPELRAHFHAVVDLQLSAVAAERGLALISPLRDHVRRSLERVAVQRALQLCHILTIEGREYTQCLPASAA